MAGRYGAAAAGTAVLFAALLPGCGGPMLAKDGTVIVGQKGSGGAAVVTANGLEIHDRTDIPRRIVQRSADDPWRAPIGFIVPRNGRFTATSSPTLLATQGLAIAMRPSDTRVPEWGGEVLIRVDVIAPAAEGTARMGEQIALVLDGDGEDARTLVETALEQMAARDRFAVVDSRGAKLVLPAIPGSHKAIGNAAVGKRLAKEERDRGARDLLGALRAAAAATAGKGTRRVVVLSDGGDDPKLPPAVRTELEKMAGDGIIVSAIASTAKAKTGVVADIGMAGMGFVGIDKALESRQGAIRTAIPPSGDLKFENLSLHFEGSPSPSHVLEASGGDVLWKLDGGEVVLGNVRAGEARTEVLRVTVPAWVPNEPFYFTVIAHYTEAGTTVERDLTARLPCIYDDDIERIAKSRHGDVIAYASALATLRRLDAAFFGDGIQNAGGIRALAELHARSMAALARDTKDPAIFEQAEVLNGLLRVGD
ncbi:hypothetical protein [Pendulispora albinea]|uniref:VWFA domain-containing protein n=1 Tax=Pendulispora albinea TaxID=2741071 RepID=A0ABZ2LXR2_9BACT